VVQSDNATEPVAGHARPDVLDEVVAEVLRAEPAAGTGRTLRNIAPKTRLKTLYRKSQKMPMASPRLASPIKLG
jgi:hypothetical protein